jgi:S-formylglutathione hydrolase FrmB
MFNRLLPLLVLAVGGCATERSAARTEAPEGGCGAPSGIATRPALSPQKGQLCVRLSLDAKAAVPTQKANVVLVWYRPEEKARFQNGLYPPFDLLEAFFDRARVVPNVTLGTQTELALDYPGGDAVVLAIADLHHAFWPTMFGAGAGNFIGVSAPSAEANPSLRRAVVELGAIPSRGAPPEGCTGDRLELVKLESPEVAGAAGNETSRRLCVVLPASYAKDPARRYPVVYLLPGFSGSDTVYLYGNNSVRPKADELAKTGGGEAIIVAVDTRTRHGSTYFTDTAADGKWDAFALKMVDEIDRRYRTRADAKSRAVVGHSTGGFNAVSLGLRHPDVFTVIGASAPDALDFETWFSGEDGKVRPMWLAWSRLENAVGGMGQMISYDAAWSEPAGKFPYDLDTGVLTAGAWDHWRAQSPLRMLDDAARAENLRKVFSGRIFLIVGKKDEFGLQPPTERFGARLTELRIPHQYTVTEGGHDSRNVQPAVLFAIGAMK